MSCPYGALLWAPFHRGKSLGRFACVCGGLSDRRDIVGTGLIKYFLGFRRVIGSLTVNRNEDSSFFDFSLITLRFIFRDSSQVVQKWGR